jgi:outer membrane lipoprotein-sorting protein
MRLPTAKALGWMTMCALLLGAAARAGAAPLETTRALAAGLARTGRAEATLSWSVIGPPGSATQSLHGSLAVEPPDRARLDVSGTGERITLRADGGEWLQPELKQFVKLTPRHSVAAMRWWRLLAGSTAAGLASERKLAAAHFRLLIMATPEAAADSADVWLDAHGLPAKLVLADGMGGQSSYKLSGWRFTHAKGVAAFRLEAPPGMETVELPELR